MKKIFILEQLEPGEFGSLFIKGKKRSSNNHLM